MKFFRILLLIIMLQLAIFANQISGYDAIQSAIVANDFSKLRSYLNENTIYKSDVESLNEDEVNVKDHSGKTLLMYAVSTGVVNKGAIKILIDKGADVNAQDTQGQTPLMIAVQNNWYSEVSELLIDRGADINAKDNNGNTVIDLVTNTEILNMLVANGAPIHPDASTWSIIKHYFNGLTSWVWVILKWTTLVVIAFAVFNIIKTWKINRRKERSKIAINKMVRQVTEIQTRLNNINCSYFPHETEEVSKIKSDLDEISSQLKGLEGKEEEYDSSTVKPKVEEAEKSSKAIAEKVRSLQEELSKVQSIFERCKEDYESTNRSVTRISEEIRSYEGFEGVETYQSRIREHEIGNSGVQDRINRVHNFEEMKRFVDQEVAGIENMVQNFRNFENEWDRFKDGIRSYQPLMQRSQTIQEQSEQSGSDCSSIGEESARELQKVFEGIAEECRTIVREISGSTHRKEASYYEERIRTLEQQYNDAQREFNEKFKAIAEFKRFSTDREKKEWILKNGYISWFFNDPKIAEKYRKFDSMEEKFKYLIVVNEKLRFLDLEKERTGEGKTTWTVFMHEIRSDMSYEEMKALLKLWQTDVKFKQKKESWQKKLNESNTEDKKLLSITNEFVGIRL